MACIVYVTNKKSNTKYAYRSESYRDPVTKKPKSRRTYLGRVDPVTNEIIPKAEKGRRNRKSVSAPPDTHADSAIDIHALAKQMHALEQKQDEIKQIVLGMDELIASIQTLIAKGSS